MFLYVIVVNGYCLLGNTFFTTGRITKNISNMAFIFIRKMLQVKTILEVHLKVENGYLLNWRNLINLMQ